MKKILSLFLSMSMLVSVAFATPFVDNKAIGSDYADDVNMLAQLGVVNGYEDGTFRPQGNITRVEYAKMAYVLNYGYDDQGKLFSGQKSEFTDVEGNYQVAWGKGYINYCANQGIVAGIGNGKFAPKANITITEVCKMLLVTLGCDPIKEGFIGPNWEANVVAKAMELGVLDGWVGDPTAYATRELVCKLMRNTIFAPTYVYSPLTGIGSQYNAATNSNNQTLGEKVMGLKHIEGIVVANGRYTLPIDEEGNTLEKAPNVTQDKSTIYYNVVDPSNYVVEEDEMGLLTINTDVSDDLLGNKVDVYFHTVNGKTELVGDVLVDADTVVYEVMSKDITIMPNGKSTSGREIKPYIEFKTENSVEKMIVRDDPITEKDESKAKLALDTENYDGAEFYHQIFVSNEKTQDLTAATGLGKIGESSIQSYRFVSVDGGDTWSYILRLNTKSVKKITGLTNDTITISGMGIKEIGEEAEIVGNVTKGVEAVIYDKDGKVFVEATETVVGKATGFTEDAAIIDGVEYYTDNDISVGELKGTTLSDYLITNKNKNNENTVYTVYKNCVIKIESKASIGVVEDYGIVLYATYDEALGVAKVKVAFTDGTEGVYEVAEFKNDDEDFSAVNKEIVGNIYKTKIENNQIILSDEAGKVENVSTKIEDGKLIIGESSYRALDNSVVFLVYGNNKKAKAYKMSNIDSVEGTGFATAVEGNTTGLNTVLVGAIQVADEGSFGTKLEDIAYVIEAKQNYNINTDEWYLDLVLITDNGILETRSIDDVRDGKGKKYETVKVGATPADLEKGKIVSYKYADGLIQSIGALADTSVKLVNVADEYKDEIYYFEKTKDEWEIAEKNFNASEEGIITVKTIDKDEHNFKVIAIDDNEFVEGGEIEYVAIGDIIKANGYNAILVLEEGKVIRVFSIYNN